MSDVRFAKIDSTSHVEAIFFGPAAWVSYPYLVQSDTAEMGDYWDGTTFTTPVPPPITLEQYRNELNAIISEMESARRNAFRDLVLAEADPPITTLAAFRADVEGRNIVWNSLLSTPEA